MLPITPLPGVLAATQAVDGGLVVVAGDAYIPCTRHHAYTNDIWRLDYTTLRWEQATVDPGQPQMEPKRGQSTMLYRVRAGCAWEVQKHGWWAGLG